MITLTNDEYTLLMLAAQGQSLISIGRWEPSIEHLVAINYLHQLDKHNNVITDLGRIAMEHHQDEVDTDMAKAMIKVHNQRVQSRPPAKVCPHCGGTLDG